MRLYLNSSQIYIWENTEFPFVPISTLHCDVSLHETVHLPSSASDCWVLIFLESWYSYFAEGFTYCDFILWSVVSHNNWVVFSSETLITYITKNQTICFETRSSGSCFLLFFSAGTCISYSSNKRSSVEIITNNCRCQAQTDTFLSDNRTRKG